MFFKTVFCHVVKEIHSTKNQERNIRQEQLARNHQ